MMSRLSEFDLTADHIKLLQHAYTSWDDCEYGAPEIDPKRPYGNSDVETDIAELLGWTIPHERYEGEAWNAMADKCRKIHKETETALQIVLSTQSFVPGHYVLEGYDRLNWKLRHDP